MRRCVGPTAAALCAVAAADDKTPPRPLAAAAARRWKFHLPQTAPIAGVPVPPPPARSGQRMPDGRLMPAYESPQYNNDVAPTPVEHNGQSRLKCEPCDHVMSKNDWTFHVHSTKHQWMVLRKRMEAANDGGCCPPPAGEYLPLNHVWCGFCAKAVGIGGNLWRQHVTSRDHMQARHRQAMAALKGGDSTKPTATGRKPKPALKLKVE